MCFYSNFLGSEEKIQFNMRDVHSVTLSSKMIYDAVELEVGKNKETYVFASFSSEKRKECYELCKKLIPEDEKDETTSSEDESGFPTIDNHKTPTLSDNKTSPSPSPPRSASPPATDKNKQYPKLSSAWMQKFETMEVCTDVSLCLDLRSVFDLLIADRAKCSCVYLSRNSPNGGETEHKLSLWKQIDGDQDEEEDDGDDDDENKKSDQDTTHFESSVKYTHQRTFEFRKKLSQPIGPNETTVYQTHRYGFFKSADAGESCVAYESIVKTPNVPYGSYFIVRMKYLLISESSSATRFRVAVCVDMLKSTMWSGTIKSATLKETKEAWSAWTRRIVAKSGKRKRGDSAISLSTSPLPKNEPPRRCCRGMFTSLEDMFDAGVTPSEGILRGGTLVFLISLVLYVLQYAGYKDALRFVVIIKDNALTTENIIVFFHTRNCIFTCKYLASFS